jgi:hypothetical protein
MALSERTRDKGARKAAKLLPPGTVVCEYVRGRAHPRTTTGAIVAIALVILVFIASLAAGRVIVPGGLLLLWLGAEIAHARLSQTAAQPMAPTYFSAPNLFGQHR